jgi:hypothetical protein
MGNNNKLLRSEIFVHFFLRTRKSIRNFLYFLFEGHEYINCGFELLLVAISFTLLRPAQLLRLTHATRFLISGLRFSHRSWWYNGCGGVTTLIPLLLLILYSEKFNS